MLSVALPEDGVALCGAGAPEKRLGNPIRPFPGAAAEGRVGVRRAPVSPAPFAPCSPPRPAPPAALTPPPFLLQETVMPAKGPLQSVQVFGRKVRPGRKARSVLLLPLGLGRALWPYALGVPRPQLGSGGGSSPGPCWGEAAVARPARQLHVSRSVGGGARRVLGGRGGVGGKDLVSLGAGPGLLGRRSARLAR